MDELRPPNDDEEPPEGLLGDIVLCPAVTARQAAEHGRTADAEAEYLLVHGLLHLLGYDHADPDEQAEMFGLKDKILAGWATDGPTAAPRGAGRDERGRLDPAEHRARCWWCLAGLMAAGRGRAVVVLQARADRLVEEGRPGPQRVRRIADDPPRYLNTALFLRTLLRDLGHHPGGRWWCSASSPPTWQAGADHGRLR